VKAEDLVVNKSGERKVIEKVGKVLPHVRVTILAQAFIIETINLSDLTGFVIASQDGNALWVSDFEGNKEGNSFDGVVATIYVVSFADVSFSFRFL
jgi:hypothetical protein